jgi:hypothetical protein
MPRSKNIATTLRTNTDNVVSFRFDNESVCSYTGADNVLFSRTPTARHRFKDWRCAFKQLSRISRLNFTLGRADTNVLFSTRRSRIVSNNNRHLLPTTSTIIIIIIISVPYVRYFIIFLRYYTVITTVRWSYIGALCFVCENISFSFTMPRNVFEQRHTQVNTEGAFYLLLFFSLSITLSLSLSSKINFARRTLLAQVHYHACHFGRSAYA